MSRDVTPEERALIPLAFATPRFWTQEEYSFYSAYWDNNQGDNFFLTSKTLETGIPGWRISVSDDEARNLTIEEFLTAYPGHQHIDGLSLLNLQGRFEGLPVRWSQSRSLWVYNNNRPVKFPSASEEAEVSDILSSVEASLVEITQRISTPRPATSGTQEASPTDSPTPAPRPRSQTTLVYPTPQTCHERGLPVSAAPLFDPRSRVHVIRKHRRH